MNESALQETLCKAFCAEIKVRNRGDFFTVALPMSARDGDSFTVYIHRTAGGWRLSDSANTMMRLSYANDLDKLLDGTRLRLYENILSEHEITEDDGEMSTVVSADHLMSGIFRLSQAMSKVEDIALWTRSRVESTFYEDLRQAVMGQVSPEQVIEGYEPNVEDGKNYIVDYRIETGGLPLFLFGVNGKDKARLVTITLLRLKQAGLSFDSMVVFNDIAEIPRADESRLLEAANDIVTKISNIHSIHEKINHRLAAGRQ